MCKRFLGVFDSVQPGLVLCNAEINMANSQTQTGLWRKETWKSQLVRTKGNPQQ